MNNQFEIDKENPAPDYVSRWIQWQSYNTPDLKKMLHDAWKRRAEAGDERFEWPAPPTEFTDLLHRLLRSSQPEKILSELPESRESDCLIDYVWNEARRMEWNVIGGEPGVEILPKDYDPQIEERKRFDRLINIAYVEQQRRWAGIEQWERTSEVANSHLDKHPEPEKWSAGTLAIKAAWYKRQSLNLKKYEHRPDVVKAKIVNLVNGEYERWQELKEKADEEAMEDRFGADTEEMKKSGFATPELMASLAYRDACLAMFHFYVSRELLKDFWPAGEPLPWESKNNAAPFLSQNKAAKFAKPDSSSTTDHPLQLTQQAIKKLKGENWLASVPNDVKTKLSSEYSSGLEGDLLKVKSGLKKAKQVAESQEKYHESFRDHYEKGTGFKDVNFFKPYRYGTTEAEAKAAAEYEMLFRAFASKFISEFFRSITNDEEKELELSDTTTEDSSPKAIELEPLGKAKLRILEYLYRYGWNKLNELSAKEGAAKFDCKEGSYRTYKGQVKKDRLTQPWVTEEILVSIQDRLEKIGLTSQLLENELNELRN